jgi:hypothetical protein
MRRGQLSWRPNASQTLLFAIFVGFLAWMITHILKAIISGYGI